MLMIFDLPSFSFAVFIIMSILITSYSKIPVRVYKKLIFIPFSFLVPATAVLIFLIGPTELYTIIVGPIRINVYKEGIVTAIQTMARAMGGISCLYFLVLTTPMAELFNGLRNIGLPEFIVEISLMIYRFIFVSIEEAERMVIAASSRLGMAGFRAHLRSFAMIGGLLFIRTWKRGENIQAAMDARCYSGRYPSLNKPLFSVWELFVVFLFEMGLIGLYYLMRWI